MRILWSFFLFAGIAFPPTEFWAPLAPPRAHYSASVHYDAAAARLEGSETIHFRNDSGRPIGRIALRWFGDSLAVSAQETALRHSPAGPNVTLFDLPQDLAPGADLTLAATFGAPWKLDSRTASTITSFVVPHIW